MEDIKVEPDLEIATSDADTSSANIETFGRGGRRRKFPTSTESKEDSSNVITSSSATKRTSTRSKRSKIQIETEDNDPAENIALETLETADIPRESRRSRKSRHEIKEESLPEEPVETTETPIQPKGRRGRKAKPVPIEQESPPQDISIELIDSAAIFATRKGRPTKDFLQQRKLLEKQIKKSTAEFTCGKCKKVVLAKSWQNHGKEHYGIYWREGIDAPLVRKLTGIYLKTHQSIAFLINICFPKFFLRIWMICTAWLWRLINS